MDHLLDVIARVGDDVVEARCPVRCEGLMEFLDTFLTVTEHHGSSIQVPRKSCFVTFLREP